MSLVTIIIIIALIFGLGLLAKHLGIYWLQVTLVICLFGFVGGCITDWIFDSFEWGFAIAAVATGISVFNDNRETSSTSENVLDYTDYSPSSHSNSAPMSFSPSSSSSNDDDEENDERERCRKSEEDRSYFEREANNAYSRYQSYVSQAEREEDQADTELRYAEDYEYRAREYDDDSARSEASSCRSKAQYNLSRAREYRSQADYYYGLYQEYKDRARTC